MVERADITRAKSQAYREGVETAMRARTNGFERMVDKIVHALFCAEHAARNDAYLTSVYRAGWLGRVSSLNGVLAGWLLVILALTLNAIEFYTAGRAPLAFGGILNGGLAIAFVYFGMRCAIGSSARSGLSAGSTVSTILSFACWLWLNKHMWGL